MLDPIMRWELIWLLGRNYERYWVARRCYGLWLAFLLLLALWEPFRNKPSRTLPLFFSLHETLGLLGIPALVISAAQAERHRPTIVELLSTALTSRDLVLGKWLACSAIVTNFWLIGLPFVCIVGGWWGLPLSWLLAVACWELLVGWSLVALTLWAMGSRPPLRAGLLSYGLTASLLFLGYRLGCPWLVLFAPLTTAATGPLGASVLTSLLWSTALGLLLLGGLLWITQRFRSLKLRHLARPQERSKYRSRPPVNDRPLFWRTRVAGRVTFWLRRTRQRGCPDSVAVGLVLSLVVVGLVWLQTWLHFPFHYGLLGLAVVVFLGMLVSVWLECATLVTREREQQTWEIYC